MKKQTFLKRIVVFGLWAVCILYGGSMIFSQGIETLDLKKAGTIIGNLNSTLEQLLDEDSQELMDSIFSEELFFQDSVSRAAQVVVWVEAVSHQRIESIPTGVFPQAYHLFRSFFTSQEQHLANRFIKRNVEIQGGGSLSGVTIVLYEEENAQEVFEEEFKAEFIEARRSIILTSSGNHSPFSIRMGGSLKPRSGQPRVDQPRAGQPRQITETGPGFTYQAIESEMFMDEIQPELIFSLESSSPITTTFPIIFFESFTPTVEITTPIEMKTTDAVGEQKTQGDTGSFADRDYLVMLATFEENAIYSIRTLRGNWTPWDPGTAYERGNLVAIQEPCYQRVPRLYAKIFT